ncbi:MAG: putative protein, methanogenesis marker protein 3, UPF0288 family [Candidatus Methanomarinus sp.]|nr:MAG: putative protein, methanogenesis marker protein 3, UPF0288 family [ANME-2 cluster archaeon]
MITIELNDVEVEIEKGSTLADILKKTQTSYTKDAIIGIVKGGEEIKTLTTEYSLFTNKGEFKIEVDSEKSELINIWLTHFTDSNLQAHWATPDVTAFGPISTDIKTDRDTYEYQRYDVIFGAGGYDAKKYLFIICKRQA